MTAVSEDYGVECSGHGVSSIDYGGVVVPEIDINLSDQQLAYIQHNFNPLQQSDINGIDVYLEVKIMY